MAKDKNTPPASEQETAAQASGALENTILPESLQNSVLESLHVLADRHRVPGWQQAGLARLMGWQDGKQISNADYVAALESLKNRRIGGGRMDVAGLLPGADMGGTGGATHRSEEKDVAGLLPGADMGGTGGATHPSEGKE